MKIPSPDAKSPPSLAARRGTLVVWTLLLAPYAFGIGVSWRLALGALIWAFCIGIMRGKIGRQNKALNAATRGWDNFTSACFMFVLVLGFLGMAAFPLLRNDDWVPLWWFGVAVLLTAGQITFAVRVLPHFTGCYNRGLLIFAIPLLICFNALSLEYINGALDWSAGQNQRAVIVAKWTFKSSKSGPSYHVRFRLADGNLAKMRVTSRFYNCTVAGQTIEVRTKRGALCTSWIAEVP